MIIRHDVDPLRYLADSQDFPAIVQLKTYQAGDILECDAMGMLIHPEWILTAAHCADESTPFPDYIQVAGQTYNVKKRVVHPGWKNADTIKEISNDIALIQLARPV